MYFKQIRTVFLFITLLAVLASCKKDEVVEEYLRGGNSLALSTDNQLIVAGYNTSTSKSYEATLIKVDQSNGDTLWSKMYGGTYADAFYNVKKSHTGGFIATGFSNKSSYSSPAMFVVITDAAGTQLQSVKYGGSYFSQGLGLLPHANADSGYLVAGYIQNSSSTDRDIYVVKIKNDGVALWEKRYGAKSTNAYDTLHDAAYGIIAAADSGYYITGSMNGYSSCCGKIFLMKISKTGDSLWTKTYDAGIGYSLTLTSDGGIAIGGTLQENNKQDIILIKTDTDGNVLWKKSYGGSGYEYGASMLETSDGGFAITGITDSKGIGYQDVYLIRTSSTGDLLWDKTYGGTNIDQGFGLIQLGDGGFGITGLTNTDGSFIYLNRTSAEGTQLWYKNLQ